MFTKCVALLEAVPMPAWDTGSSEARLRPFFIVTPGREKSQVSLAASGLVSRACIADVGWIGVWVYCAVRLPGGLPRTKSKLFTRLLCVRVYENVCLLLIFTCVSLQMAEKTKQTVE